MKTKHFLIVGIVALSLAYAGCKKEQKENNLLNNSYLGDLELYFTNTYPEFQSSKKVNVHVSKDGTVTFGTGTLSYSGEEINNSGDGKIKREGIIDMSPSGTIYKNQNGDVHISVNENSVIHDHTIMWVLANGQWMEVSNTNYSETWNGGLDFDLNEATGNGSIIEVNTSGGTVKWTLSLLPELTD